MALMKIGLKEQQNIIIPMHQMPLIRKSSMIQKERCGWYMVLGLAVFMFWK